MSRYKLRNTVQCTCNTDRLSRKHSCVTARHCQYAGHRLQQLFSGRHHHGFVARQPGLTGAFPHDRSARVHPPSLRVDRQPCVHRLLATPPQLLTGVCQTGGSACAGRSAHEVAFLLQTLACVDAVCLRADLEPCVLHGDRLRSATARTTRMFSGVD